MSISEHSPQVPKPWPVAHERISHIEHQPNFTPSVRQPIQLMVSGVMAGELFISAHFAAVVRRNSSSFVRVAIRASQVSQSSPQQAIRFFIVVIYFKVYIYCFASETVA